MGSRDNCSREGERPCCWGSCGPGHLCKASNVEPCLTRVQHGVILRRRVQVDVQRVRGLGEVADIRHVQDGNPVAETVVEEDASAILRCRRGLLGRCAQCQHCNRIGHGGLVVGLEIVPIFLALLILIPDGA